MLHHRSTLFDNATAIGRLVRNTNYVGRPAIPEHSDRVIWEVSSRERSATQAYEHPGEVLAPHAVLLFHRRNQRLTFVILSSCAGYHHFAGHESVGRPSVFQVKPDEGGR